jgi:hypothetical protein
MLTSLAGHVDLYCSFHVAPRHFQEYGSLAALNGQTDQIMT